MRLEFEPTVNDPYAATETQVAKSTERDPVRMLEKGISAAQSGDRVLAKKLLSEAASLDPGCPDAWMWLASIAEYPEELLACLDRVLELEPTNARAKEWHSATQSLLARNFVQSAVSASGAGDDARAKEFFDQALAHDPECEAAWLGKAKMAKDDSIRAGLVERVLAINPENAEALAVVAEIRRSHAESRLAQAKSAAVAGYNAEALNVLAEILEADPSNVEAWMLRSHLSSDLPQKMNALAKVLEIDPQHSAARASFDFLSTAVESAPAPTVVEAEEVSEPAAYPESSYPGAEPHQPGSEFLAPAIDPFATIVSNSVEVFDADEEYVGMVETTHHLEDEATSVSAVEVDMHDVGDQEWADEAAVAEVFDQTQAAYAEDAYAPSAEDLDGDVPTAAAHSQQSATVCPYCHEETDGQAFECGNCRATLTLSDMEALLSNPFVDRSVVQTAVTAMEGEWNLRDLLPEELIMLGIGHFNLGNSAGGIKYLQEASTMRPNDVILAGHINALSIRLDELRRKNELDESRPTGRRILVVDDSATVRKLISGKLEKSGHTVLCAGDGVEGLAKVSEHVPDLVLLDITMPRMDGYEVCRQIRSNPNTKHVPVVMISGKDGFFDKVRGRMAGTTAYITKPFGPETLMKALETYLTEHADGMAEELDEEPVAA